MKRFIKRLDHRYRDAASFNIGKQCTSLLGPRIKARGVPMTSSFVLFQFQRVEIYIHRHISLSGVTFQAR